ncbi:MAG: hypothetical protein WD557_16460 [Dehalococcoidia bacterium]
MPISRARELLIGLEPATYERTGDATDEYNCLAWAFGITDQWIWPASEQAAWPDDLQLADEFESIVAFAERQGFQLCQGAELEPEPEKIAIYAHPESGEPTHVALQLSDGRSSSKLGDWEDIAHAAIDAVSARYGVASTFMRRPRTSAPH